MDVAFKLVGAKNVKLSDATAKATISHGRFFGLG